MLITRLLTCLGVVALTAPALGAQFFIAQDPGQIDARLPTSHLPRALVR
jgi:hypothetical protein